MEYGHICFAYSKDEWIARAIAWFTKSKWSHSFITVPPMLGQDMVMEAGGKGVSMILFDKAYRNNKNQRYEIYRFHCDQQKVDEAILVCADHLQETYGFLQYPWFMWRSLNAFWGRDIKKYNNWSSQGEVCSDLVRRMIEAAGRKDLFKDYGTDSANAQDIYDVVKSNPELFELIESRD